MGVAQDLSARREQLTDRIERTLGLALLYKADRCIDQDHAEDHRRIELMPDQQGDCARAQQHVEQDIVELQQETFEWPVARSLWQHVGAVTRAARASLGGAQPLDSRTSRRARQSATLSACHASACGGCASCAAEVDDREDGAGRDMKKSPFCCRQARR